MVKNYSSASQTILLPVTPKKKKLNYNSQYYFFEHFLGLSVYY